jgi:hypothetical protein
MRLFFLILFFSLSFTSNAQYGTDTCDITREVDDFTNEVTLRSPMISPFARASDAVFYPIGINKYINKNVVTYYLSLETHSVSVSSGNKGVIVLFTDGSKWQRPSEKVDVNVDDHHFRYSAFIRLSAADLQVFSNKQIKKYRLYIYDEELTSEFADQFRGYVKCIRHLK